MGYPNRVLIFVFFLLRFGQFVMISMYRMKYVRDEMQTKATPTL